VVVVARVLHGDEKRLYPSYIMFQINNYLNTMKFYTSSRTIQLNFSNDDNTYIHFHQNYYLIITKLPKHKLGIKTTHYNRNKHVREKCILFFVCEELILLIMLNLRPSLHLLTLT